MRPPRPNHQVAVALAALSGQRHQGLPRGSGIGRCPYSFLAGRRRGHLLPANSLGGRGRGSGVDCKRLNAQPISERWGGGACMEASYVGQLPSPITHYAVDKVNTDSSDFTATKPIGMPNGRP